MTESTPIDAQKQVWNELKAANDALHVKHTVTFADGPAEGSTFEVPDGVMNIKVDTPEGTFTYLRSEREEMTFRVYKKQK